MADRGPTTPRGRGAALLAALQRRKEANRKVGVQAEEPKEELLLPKGRAAALLRAIRAKKIGISGDCAPTSIDQITTPTSRSAKERLVVDDICEEVAQIHIANIPDSKETPFHHAADVDIDEPIEYNNYQELDLSEKNPVSILNELRGSRKYQIISVSGPPHNPLFKVLVKVDGQRYCGTGTSKKLARSNAAENALRSLTDVRDGGNEFSRSKSSEELKDQDGLNARKERYANRSYSLLPKERDVVNNFKTTITIDNKTFSTRDGQNTRLANAPMKPIHTELNLGSKNPVTVLNELGICRKYGVFGVSGPSHKPVFRVYAEVEGKRYFGLGASKKIARTKAAEEALKSYSKFPGNRNSAYGITSGLGRNTSIMGGNTSNVGGNRSDVGAVSHTVTSNSGGNTSGVGDSKCVVPMELPDQNPVMVLNQLYPNAIYTFIPNELETVNKFKTTITIDNESFSGTGSNKKRAKTAAATIALAKLLNDQPELGSNMSRESILKADEIGRMVNETFSKIMRGDVEHSRRKVLAGIVMSRRSTLDDAEVICVTTGTKCVSGGHICLNGSSLNDMHAEILARRCLMNYLYDQLTLLTNPDLASTSIFKQKNDKKGYRLADGIEFHLYINTAPCGDARIFSPHEDSASDQHPNRVSRGQLRTKIESGEGTIPIKDSSGIQTWDGILQGERLLTMSCSDKICKWNVLGLQGALLSHFVEPIYLKSLVLGSLMKESHLYRALCGRIENALGVLPPRFELNRPEMLKSTSTEPRQPQKAPNFGVIWMKGMDSPEIVSTEKGKPELGVSSVVCKQKLSRRFLSLHGKLSTIDDEEIRMTSYAEAKDSVKNYVVAKQVLYETFKKARLGTWVTKPLEQDLFEFSAIRTS